MADYDEPGHIAWWTAREAARRLRTGRPGPPARQDPGEWRAFFREFTGRDMPLNAQHRAAWARVEAALAPGGDGAGSGLEQAMSQYLSREFDQEQILAEELGVHVDVVRGWSSPPRPGFERVPDWLWLRPAPLSGPYPPEEALLRFEARRAGGADPCLLAGDLEPLAGDGARGRFALLAWRFDLGAIRPGGGAHGIPWREAVDTARRWSLSPQVEYAEISTGSGRPAFRFVRGKAVGSGAPLPSIVERVRREAAESARRPRDWPVTAHDLLATGRDALLGIQASARGAASRARAGPRPGRRARGR